MHVFRERASAITQTHNNKSNNSEFYLHDFNNTALQKQPKYKNYISLVIRVQLQH